MMLLGGEGGAEGAEHAVGEAVRETFDPKKFSYYR